MVQIGRRADQVDVMGPLCLQLEHDLGESSRANDLAEMLLRDSVVLAESALEIAVRKEDRARTSRAAEARFFMEVPLGLSNLQLVWSPAYAQLMVTVNGAQMRTDVTG